MKEPVVAIDCERMKYPFTGLYNFCLHLGKALVPVSNYHYKLQFFVPETESGIFGSAQQYLIQKSWQKFVFPYRGMDLWHCLQQGSNYFPHSKKVKFLYTIHDLNFLHESLRKKKQKKYLHHVQKLVDRADYITTISQFSLNDVQAHINLRNKPVQVIYNGCSITPLPHLTPPALLPQQPFLFTIGTIAPKKNFHVLPCLLARNDWQLVIAGITQNEAYKEQIIAEAKKWRVEDRVLFSGTISENDKQWYLQNCTAFVFPSIAEGFGLPVIEAMHFGKPAILSTCTSLPEVGGQAAYYFKSFEPEHMQQTLADSLHHYEEKDRTAAIREWAGQFSWQKSANAYHHLYCKLLNCR